VTSPPISRPLAERVQAWLWTGPLGHLYGGLVDFVTLLSRILWGRVRRATGRAANSR
jgi:hypothetical protein